MNCSQHLLYVQVNMHALPDKDTIVISDIHVACILQMHKHKHISH